MEGFLRLCFRTSYFNLRNNQANAQRIAEVVAANLWLEI